MITTVTLNPCIDRTVTVERFTYGSMNRILESRTDVSGKGINVAIVHKNLGGKSFCTGINYRIRGEMIEGHLDALGIPYDFVTVDGEVRINLKILDRSRGVITEVNESGYPVEEKDLHTLVRKVKEMAAKSSIVVLSGSVPRQVPPEIYRELLTELKDLPVRTVLDAEGQLLLEGVKAKPYLVKPNDYELEKAFGRQLDTHADFVEAAKKLIEQGVSIVCVSLGAKGAIIVDEREAFFAPALPVPVKSTVGAGDSMVAALCLAMEQDMALADMLRYGTAAAAATVMKEGTELCTKADFDRIFDQVVVEKLNL